MVRVTVFLINFYISFSNISKLLDKWIGDS
jgi:hypothetical protein